MSYMHKVNLRRSFSLLENFKRTLQCLVNVVYLGRIALEGKVQQRGAWWYHVIEGHVLVSGS